MNTHGILQGRLDVNLTLEGKKQARRLSRWIMSRSVVQIYSSPLIRAVESAAIVSSKIGIDYVVRDELVERDYRRFDGLDRENLKAERTLLGLSNDDPTQDWHGCFDVESDEAIWARVQSLLEEVNSIYPTKVTLFVTHAGVIKAILHSIFDIPHYRHLCFNIPNGCVVGLRHTLSGYQLVELYPDLSLLK
jgi:probable phosphoglycerate mutase